MRRMMLILALAAAVGAAGFAQAAEKVYGKGVSSTDTTLVSTILAHPDQYLDKVVRVEGTVVGVCKARGCWIQIASDQEYQKIMLKVEDGVIVFPPEIIGEHVIVEGTLTGTPMSYEQSCAYLEGEAKCQNETFDKAAVPPEGVTFYQIAGTGAVVRQKQS